MSPLHDLAAAAGLQPRWQDAGGRAQTVTDEALQAILNALGLPAESEAAIRASLATARAARAEPPSFVSADIGAPVSVGEGDGPAVLTLEDGSSSAVTIVDGQLPGITELGYHTLKFDGRDIRLAIAPPRCVAIADVDAGGRLWGPAVQIPALRDRRGTEFGDFGTLADTVRAFATRGADAVAISPTHALFPADATRFSPYAPSSRQFLNVMLADPSMIAGDAPADAGSPPALIDWAGAIPDRLVALRRQFDTLPDTVRAEVEAFGARGGSDLRFHAAFDALHAHFLAQSGARGWQDWPAAYQDPDGAAVAAFMTEQRDTCDFYVFLQWLADAGLERAQRTARDGGMAVGLVADLAVGMDPGGSHAWRRRGDLLNGLSIGAPPDPLGPDGQAWGITGFDPRALAAHGFAPFIATIRAGLAHAGGLRIDHAFGLRRLWVVPDGASAADGAYLDMPFADMMRIIALESHRARAIIIGEDLGTVPDGFREAMDARAMLGMRVLWFERDGDGDFIPPDSWSVDAVAMSGTHDLATIAGWWQGRDIAWNWALGRTSEAADEAADHAARAEDRSRLWTALGAPGPQPDPSDTAPVVDAALAHVARTPCGLAIFPLEDLVGLVEQPNLPGTTDEHPNWRRRMPDTTDALLARPDTAARIALIETARAS